MNAKTVKTLGKKYRFRGMEGTLKAIVSSKNAVGVGADGEQSFLGALGELQLTPFITYLVPLDELEEIEEPSDGCVTHKS